MSCPSPFPGKCTTALTALAALAVLSCNSSQQTKELPRPVMSMAATSTENVSVVFEGPWAFVADPQDSNMILALAPKTSAHHDLRVGSSNLLSLNAGVYELSVPEHGVPSPAGFGSTFAQVKIDVPSLQAAVRNKAARYVIRLPKPEAYLAMTRVMARVGTNYPPDPTTEQNYISSVSLRYAVSRLDGFSVSGTPDTGTLTPWAVAVESPIIHFVIEPTSYDPLDRCDLHARRAFADLVKLLNVKLYLDYPGEPDSCHKNDPQKMAGMNLMPWPVMAAFLAPPVIPTWSTTTSGTMAASLLAIHVTDCKAPMLFLSTNPQ